MNIAFILLDPQCDFFGDDNPSLAAFKRTIPIINRVSKYCHEHSLPVVIIQHTSPKLPAHTPPWEIYPQILFRPEDRILRKHYQNAFWKSQLNQLLRGLHIDTLLIAGYMAEHCVLSTYRGAVERGFKPTLLADGIAGGKHSEVVLEWCKNIFSPILLSNNFSISPN